MRMPTLAISTRIRRAAIDDSGRTAERADSATVTAASNTPTTMTRRVSARPRSAVIRRPQHAPKTAARDRVHHSAIAIDPNAPHRHARLSVMASQKAGTANSA